MADDSVTMYKGTKSIQVSPDAYDEAVGKGWTKTQPSFLSRVADSVGEQSNPKNLIHLLQKVSGPEMIKNLLMGNKSGAGPAVAGAASGMGHLTAPGIAKDLIQKKDMAPTVAGAGLMMAGGEEEPGAVRAAGEGIEKISGLDKINSGSHADALKELEDFRQTVKAKPTKRMMDVANVKHKALTDRVDREWNETYSVMKAKPTDAEAVGRGLKELSKVDPETKAWVRDHIEPSKSGQSVTAPLWEEVQRLKSKLNKQLANPNLDPVVRGEIPNALKSLKDATRSAAKTAGIETKYLRAEQLTRNLENIKFHTAYKASAIKPSPMYEIGGIMGGLYVGHAMGGETGGLATALAGKMLGGQAGKAMTPKGQFSIPERSIAAERGVWRKLGERPPKNIGKSKIQLDPQEATAP